MVDFYAVLGVSPSASADEIKRAYRKAVFAHHPDTNPEGGRASDQRFLEVQEAWNVLRDEGKRAQYDRMREAGFAGGGADYEQGGGYGMPWGQPSVDDKDFDAAFDAWWKKMSEEFRDYEEQQFARERMNAERMAKAAAWQWEKEQAQLNKVRTERLKQRADDARMQRHATTLRRFWQTHSGVTRGDALVAALFLAGTAGIALTWRAHIQEARQHAQHVQHAQQQQQAEQQQGEQRRAPSLGWQQAGRGGGALPAAAAVAQQS